MLVSFETDVCINMEPQRNEQTGIAFLSMFSNNPNLSGEITSMINSQFRTILSSRISGYHSIQATTINEDGKTFYQNSLKQCKT